MNFTTEAHVDEYIIDSDNTVPFTGSDGTLTYTSQDSESKTSIPINDTNTILFEQDDTLNRHTFLGVFFSIVALVLTALPSYLLYTKTISTPEQGLFVAFLYVFAVASWNSAYEFLSHTDREVIYIHIDTDEQTHVLGGDLDDEGFVNACEELIESDAPTVNHNLSLEKKIN